MMKRRTKSAETRAIENRGFSAQDAWWLSAIKATIARFSRGNIAAQNKRILTQEEQEREHARAVKIAEKWRTRAERSKAA